MLELLHLLHAIVPADDGTSLLRLKFCDLNFALPVLVFTGFLHAVISLLYKVQGLRHVLAVRHHLLELALFFIDFVDLLFSVCNVSPLL